MKSADIQEKDGYIQIEVPETERDAYDTIIELGLRIRFSGMVFPAKKMMYMDWQMD